MARFTLEMLEGMAYSDILRLAKERNVSTVRKKKVYLIRKLLQLNGMDEIQEDSTGDGQKEFRKASIQGLAGGDNGVRDKETRRSTFLVKPNGLPQENNEADNNKSIRRSTFLVKLEGLPEQNIENKENLRRSTFLINPEGLPKDNNETENKENMRRSTFLIKPEGFPEENDAENEENKRRSTFLIKPDDLTEENNVPENKENTRRSTFLIKPEDLPEENIDAKNKRNTRRSTFLIKPEGLSEGKVEAENKKNTRRSIFLEGLPKDDDETESKENTRRSTFLIKPDGIAADGDVVAEAVNTRRSTFIKTKECPVEDKAGVKEETRRSTVKPEGDIGNGFGCNTTIGLQNITISLETVDEQDEFVTPKSSPFIKTTVASERRESTRRSIHGRKISSSASKENIQKKDMAKTPKQMVVKPFQRGPVKVSATAKTPIINKNTPQARSTTKTPLQKPVRKSTMTNSGLKPKMPNFSAIHQRQFDRMESLVDHKKRTAMRAIHFFSPPLNRRANIKNDELAVQLPKGDTMIGFKQKLVRSKSFIPVPVAPTLAKSTSGGATPKLETRSSLASRLHKKSTSVDKLREKERFVIQGVRANRRFLLQMQSRNIT